MNAEQLLAVLPQTDGIPSPGSPSGAQTPEELLSLAETLRIPWKRLLQQEIEAEERLRRFLADEDSAGLLTQALTVLPLSFLHSWRVRDRIETLASQARAGAVRGAVRQLRLVFRRLLGKGDRESAAFGEHLWFAYQRVLLLQRAWRAAARSRGQMAERIAFVCTTTRCSYDDAAWAVGQDVAPRRGHRLEAAIRKVREEGFRIPRAESEARSLEELRRAVYASPARRRRPNPNSPTRLQDLVWTKPF